MREAYEKVARNEIGRFGIVQEILRKSTDFLRRVIVGRSHLVACLPALQQFSIGGRHPVVSRGHGVGNNRKKPSSWCCAVYGGKYECRAPN